MVCGYQRQHRKGIQYLPFEGADSKTTDQYTKLITHVCNVQGIHEDFSKGCEQAAICGLVLAQPYLDFTGSDPLQGQVKMKIWEYNSFVTDSFWRNSDMSDANIIWCQEYISKKEAEDRFPDRVRSVTPMSANPQRYSNFYFLPENYNMYRNDLLVLSYIWYKWKRKKEKLYSRSKNQFFDFAGGQENLDAILYNIPDLEVVQVEVPTWKLAVVLNDQLIFQGNNPLGFDECPFVPIFWNMDHHLSQYDLRDRGLMRSMRDSNYLLNRRIILNHDISETTINAGWKRKVGAVANEDNLKKAGQGWDLIINEGYEMTDVEKIIPSSVPESDMALAEQLRSLIFGTSGVDLENWSAQNDKNASSLTTLLKQAANLTVLQKYFDQWDYSLKLIGDRLLQIVLNNWEAAKVQLLIGEEPTPYFYSRIFSQYQVLVEEGILTPTQQNMQAQKMMDINTAFGREVFAPSMVVKNLAMQGKAEAMEYLQSQEQNASAMQQEQMNVAHAMEHAQLQEMHARAMNQIASARERHGRYEADLGLLEERLAEIGKNNALSAKAKAEAIKTLVETATLYGDLEAGLAMREVEQLTDKEVERERVQREEAKRSSLSSQFAAKLLEGMEQNANV